MAATPPTAFRVPAPSTRRLRAFAFDPSLDTDLDAAVINQLRLEVPWEKDLQPGPVGEYFAVVDVDPASDCCYAPVDLNHPHLLAQDGLPPAEGVPQFHQQMVYAVAMTTVRNFEKALGRRALWAVRTDAAAKGKERFSFVRRLRIYPHALREANAYYSPEKKAILFGYFPASATEPGRNLPGGLVFTCLSHDVVAHETTHALLDGLHRRFNEPSNPDVLALHEGFADLVALFQHFSFPEVLQHQIARTRGDLGQQNLLAELAQQFGQAIGHRGALRSALGDPPPPAKAAEALAGTTEPHQRGAILVAAVFDAFLAVYKQRVADLMRIATGGSGVLPQGAMHPDLVRRVAQEAAKTAGHFQRIVIRALDYCPPVDVDFGDFLRAMITADHDLVPNDPHGYRIALIEAFRRRAIYPRGVRSLSVENLLWRPPSDLDARALQDAAFANQKTLLHYCPDWGFGRDREQAYADSNRVGAELNKWFHEPKVQREIASALGLTLDEDAPQTITRSRRYGLPALEVHSVRPAYRIGPDGRSVTDLVVEITQKRYGYVNERYQAKRDESTRLAGRSDFVFRGGCTVLVDLESGRVRYVIRKNILDAKRLGRQREFLATSHGDSLAATYFGSPQQAFYGRGRGAPAEPFALVHRSEPPPPEPTTAPDVPAPARGGRGGTP